MKTFDTLEEELRDICGDFEDLETKDLLEERKLCMKLLKFAECFNDLSDSSESFKEDLWKSNTLEEISKCFYGLYFDCLEFAKEEDEKNCDYSPDDDPRSYEFLKWRNA